jgi:hypothetical protein
MYVIVETNDSSDPYVFGCYDTREQAEEQAKKYYKQFGSREWRSETILTVTKIRKKRS